MLGLHLFLSSLQATYRAFLAEPQLSANTYSTNTNLSPLPLSPVPVADSVIKLQPMQQTSCVGQQTKGGTDSSGTCLAEKLFLSNWDLVLLGMTTMQVNSAIAQHALKKKICSIGTHKPIWGVVKKGCGCTGARPLCCDSGKGGGPVGAVGGGHSHNHAQRHQPDVPLLGKEQL